MASMEEDGGGRGSNKKRLETMISTRLLDVVLDIVILYIHDSKDRDAMLQVCRRWYELDSLTWKHVTIVLCYTTSPDRLCRHFPHLESLKLKEKPRATMFNLIPESVCRSQGEKGDESI